MWNERVLPAEAVPVPFSTVLRASLVPIAVWLGIAGFVWCVYAPMVTAVLGALFLASFLAGVVLRHRKGHSVRCSVWSAFGGLFDKAMLGF
ncbi:hypothetical protein [Streptomyces sp. NPDC054863]